MNLASSIAFPARVHSSLIEREGKASPILVSLYPNPNYIYKSSSHRKSDRPGSLKEVRLRKSSLNCCQLLMNELPQKREVEKSAGRKVRSVLAKD